MAYINVAENGLGAGYSGANFNEMFLQPVFTDEDIMSNYRVIPNVRHKLNLYKADPLSCIVQSYDGCDDTDYTGKKFEVGMRTITAGRMRVALEQCQDEFFGTYIEESYRAGIDVFNLQGTDLMNTIMTNVKRSIVNDLVNLAWFGDTGAGTAAGDECINSTDGFLKHMSAASGGVTDTTWAAGALSAGDAVSAMRDVMEDSDPALLAMASAEKCFWVSPNVYFNYIASVEGGLSGVGGDQAHMTLVNGMPVYYFRGVEVRPMYSWTANLAASDIISANQLIVFGAKKNFVLGTDTNDPSNQLKFWYDEYREKMIIRSYFKFGTQFVHDSLISWAYRADS